MSSVISLIYLNTLQLVGAISLAPATGTLKSHDETNPLLVVLSCFSLLVIIVNTLYWYVRTTSWKHPRTLTYYMDYTCPRKWLPHMTWHGWRMNFSCIQSLRFGGWLNIALCLILKNHTKNSVSLSFDLPVRKLWIQSSNYLDTTLLELAVKLTYLYRDIS